MTARKGSSKSFAASEIWNARQQITIGSVSVNVLNSSFMSANSSPMRRCSWTIDKPQKIIRKKIAISITALI